MNGLFFHRLTSRTTYHQTGSFFLTFLLLTLFGSRAAAQDVLSKCSEEIPTFVGTAMPTLCEQNPNFQCQTQIGAGTPYPKSSLLTSPVLSGNVCIVGDFEVDGQFTFQDALVKVSTGVTIRVKPSPNGYDSGGWLVIDNSKLFACNGLWKGITVGFLSSIGTLNNSEIEDAETAISASGLCALSIQQTTFNRNRVGVSLTNPFPSVFSIGPQTWAFGGNRFTCNAPINGTTGQISYSGVNLHNAYLFTSQTAGNTFEDLRFGINCTGQAMFLQASNLVFNRIRNVGINMEYGYLNLKKCNFNNCADQGISILTSCNVSISDGCKFVLDDNVLPQVPDPYKWYTGIQIWKLALASRTKIAGNHFDVDFSSIDRNSTEVDVNSPVEGGSKVEILSNRFHSYGQNNHGVSISANFPSNSTTDITGNIFDIKNLSPIDLLEFVPVGILVSGNQNNLRVFDNTFFNTGTVDNYYARGMSIAGSEGISNSISNNHFDDQGAYLRSYSNGIGAFFFKNTTYCANDFYNSEIAFSFAGPNEGTNLSGNTVYGGQFINLHSSDTWIEDQDQTGNQWTSEFNGSQLPVVVSPQAFCVFTNASFVDLSEFRVHTEQSTAYSGTGYNPFHPKDIDPDMDDEWWRQVEGTPGDCIDWRAVSVSGGDSGLKRMVSDGSFAAQYNDPAQTWQAERSVYFALKRNPSLETAYPAYASFRSSKQSGNIGKLYDVAIATDAAISGNPTLVSDADNNQSVIEGLVAEIGAAGTAWEIAATPAQKQAAQDLKTQKLSELSAALQTSSDLQASYDQGLSAAIPNIQQINNSISATNTLEGYEKTVNAIRLGQLTSGGITEGQLQQLLPIASLCPQDGGMAVFQARVLIPSCLGYRFNDEVSGCYPAPVAPSMVASRSEPTTQATPESGTVVVPNPASDLVTVVLPSHQTGKIALLSTGGKLMVEKDINGPQTQLETSGIPAGIYLIRVELGDGSRKMHKLIIKK